MDTRFFFLFLLMFIGWSAKAEKITEKRAGEILQSHLIRIMEAKDLYPDLPDSLPIKFSEETLNKNRGAWLVPLKIDSFFEYVLIRANFENEIYSLGCQSVDTLSAKEAEKILWLIKKVRPWFPGRDESGIPFKYFFRTKDGNKIKTTAISYDGKNFITTEIPKEVELAMMNKDSISYLVRNKKGVEIQFEEIVAPQNHLKKNQQQSIFFLTLFYCR